MEAIAFSNYLIKKKKKTLRLVYAKYVHNMLNVNYLVILKVPNCALMFTSIY